MPGKDTRPDANQRLGLLDIEIGQGMVFLTIYPPGQRSAQIHMTPDDARALSSGIAQAAILAELGADSASKIAGELQPEGGTHEPAAGA